MAWLGDRYAELVEEIEKGELSFSVPLGGSVGKEGDCLVLVGFQNDNVDGPRSVDEGDQAGFVASQLLWSLESRLEKRWCVAAARDYFPSDHCLFADRAGKKGRRSYCISGTVGTHFTWRVHAALSHLKALAPHKVLVGFKSYHEQIHSPSAFQYSKEVIDDLRGVKIQRERDMTRLVTKLLTYTGCTTAKCFAAPLPTKLCMTNLNAPPDVMAVVPSGGTNPSPPLHDAILSSLGKKQLRRVFVLGIPFEEDVVDTAIAAKDRKIVSDVYIVVDACRAHDRSKIAAVVEILKKYRIKLTTFAQAVVDLPSPAPYYFNEKSLEKLHFETSMVRGESHDGRYFSDDAGVMYCPFSEGPGYRYVHMFSPEACLGELNRAGAVRDKEEEVAFVFGDEQRGATPAASPETVPVARAVKDTPYKAYRIRLQRFGLSTEWHKQLLIRAAKYAEFCVRNENGEWDPCVTDSPSTAIPPKLRLATHFLRWLGRDETRSSPWRYDTPAIRLRTKFPSGLSSTSFALGWRQVPEFEKMYGTQTFQMTVEDTLSLAASCTFTTSCGAVAELRRVLHKAVSVQTLPFFALRLDVPVRSIMNPSKDVTNKMRQRIEQQYGDLRSRGPGVSRSEKAETLWLAERITEQASDWRTEAGIASLLGQWIGLKRAAMVDRSERKELDEVLDYTLAEIATLGVAAVEGFLFAAGSGTEKTANQFVGHRNRRIVFVSATSPNFYHSTARRRELGRYFSQQGNWVPGGQAALHVRMQHLWRCILSSFRNSSVKHLSLTPLGCRPIDLEAVPDACRTGVVLAMICPLFSLLEEPWGFGSVYYQTLPQNADLVLKESERAYAYCCSVIVHQKDAKSVANELSSSNLPVETGLLNIADPEAVVLGAVGGSWERAAERYSFQEDLANTSTILLSHVGVRAKGLAGEVINFHAADTPLRSILGSPDPPEYDASSSAGENNRVTAPDDEFQRTGNPLAALKSD
ncbi:Nicotinamidase/pyrazinamidase [Diplonema papillatum]|nr:Nicotinamidase/pyrazinamidase [Diplonema papillatum]